MIPLSSRPHFNVVGISVYYWATFLLFCSHLLVGLLWIIVAGSYISTCVIDVYTWFELDFSSIILFVFAQISSRFYEWWKPFVSMFDFAHPDSIYLRWVIQMCLECNILLQARDIYRTGLNCQTLRARPHALLIPQHYAACRWYPIHQPPPGWKGNILRLLLAECQNADSDRWLQYYPFFSSVKIPPAPKGQRAYLQRSRTSVALNTSCLTGPMRLPEGEQDQEMIEEFNKHLVSTVHNMISTSVVSSCIFVVATITAGIL